MIEKEKDRGGFYIFWGGKNSCNNKIEEFVFDNCLIGVVVELLVNDY